METLASLGTHRLPRLYLQMKIPSTLSIAVCPDVCSSDLSTLEYFFVARPCAFFQRGACPKGDNCNYLHDLMPKSHKAGPTISSTVLVASPKPEKLDLPSTPPPQQSVPSSKLSSSSSTQCFSPHHSRTSSSISSTETAVEHVADGNPKLLDDEFLESYVDEDDVIVYIRKWYYLVLICLLAYRSGPSSACLSSILNI